MKSILKLCLAQYASLARKRHKRAISKQRMSLEAEAFIPLKFVKQRMMSMSLTPYALTCEYRQAALGVSTKSPVFGYKLASDKDGEYQTAYRITVTDEDGVLIADSGKVEGDKQFGIALAFTKPLEQLKEYSFSVTVWDSEGVPSSEVTSGFVTGVFKSSGWRAHWLRIWHYGSVHFFRRTFEIADASKIRYAYAFIGALGEKGGSCVPFINGKRVGDAVCFPGAAEYFSAQYAVFDVKDMLISGKNALGLCLARTASMMIKIKYTDGTEELVSTLRQLCKTKVGGGYTLGYGEDMQRGKVEELDAREALCGFSDPEFDDSEWEIAGEEHPIIDLAPLFIRPQYCVTKIGETLRPVSVSEYGDGVLIDFGRNMAGFVRFALKGSIGKQIELRYAEKLDENGAPVMDGWRGAYLKYTFATDGIEEFTPMFTYTGFRYVLLKGYGEVPDGECFFAESIHADVLNSSRFECSDEAVNRICTVARRSFLSNLVNIPTDCPERERRGWTADAYAVCEAESVNFNMLTFFSQWLESMRDCQRGNGWIPVELPLSSDDCIDINWPAAAVLLPYSLYVQYADKRLIKRFMPMMTAWVDLLCELSDEDYEFCGGLMSYKDWIAREPASHSFLAAAYLYRCASLLAELAQAVQDGNAAEKYGALASDVRRSINAKHLHREGGRVWYDTGSQSANAHALFFGICDEADREAVTDSIARDMEEKQTSTTGFMGTMCQMQALSSNGRSDLAYKLLKNKNEGGWLYLIEKCNATTFPEHYNGAGSQNHAFLGSAPGLWLYKNLVGICPAEPAYKRVRIAPFIPEDMEFASASVDTLFGVISAEWRKTDKGVTLSVTLPPNVTGEAELCGRTYPLSSGRSEITSA